MASFLGELMTSLRSCGELDITDAVAARLAGVFGSHDRSSPSQRTIVAAGQGPIRHQARSMLKSQIPLRISAKWDGDKPGFVEIDLSGHEGGNPPGHSGKR